MPGRVFSTKHRGIGKAFLDQVDGDTHRGIFLAAQCAGHRLVHRDQFGGMADRQTAAELVRQPLQLRTQDFLASDQNGGAIGVMTQEFKNRGQRYRRAVVAAHAIHREGDRHRSVIFRDSLCKNGRTRGTHPADFGSLAYSPLALTTFLPR
jgi:hypothetical protein